MNKSPIVPNLLLVVSAMFAIAACDDRRESTGASSIAREGQGEVPTAARDAEETAAAPIAEDALSGDASEQRDTATVRLEDLAGNAYAAVIEKAEKDRDTAKEKCEGLQVSEQESCKTEADRNYDMTRQAADRAREPEPQETDTDRQP